MTTLLIAAAIVFVLNAAGSFIEFNNRFVNALVDTVLFAIVFGLLLHFGYLHMDFLNVVPAAPAAAPRQLRNAGRQAEPNRWLRRFPLSEPGLPALAEDSPTGRHTPISTADQTDQISNRREPAISRHACRASRDRDEDRHRLEPLTKVCSKN